MRSPAVLRRIAALAMAAPASVPGAYAWTVTVAPVVWSRPGVSVVAQASAVAGLLFLPVGTALERHFGRRIRSFYLGGFTAACAAAWVIAASGAGDPLLDDVHLAVGVLAWAVFGLSWAAAPLKAWDALPRASASVPIAEDSWPRQVSVPAASGVLLAVALQLVVIHSKSPERALLVRLVVVAFGLVVIGASTKLALAQFRRRKRLSTR